MLSAATTLVMAREIVGWYTPKIVASVVWRRFSPQVDHRNFDTVIKPQTRWTVMLVTC